MPGDRLFQTQARQGRREMDDAEHQEELARGAPAQQLGGQGVEAELGHRLQPSGCNRGDEAQRGPWGETSLAEERQEGGEQGMAACVLNPREGVEFHTTTPRRR